MAMSYRAPAVFALLWLAGTSAVVAAGFSVDAYMLRVMRIPLPHPYPLSGVVTTSVALALELAVIYAVLRPATYDKSCGRALGAAFVAAIAFLLSLVFLMHGAPYWGAYCLVLFWLTLGLLVLFLVSAATRIYSGRRGLQT